MQALGRYLQDYRRFGYNEDLSSMMWIDVRYPSSKASVPRFVQHSESSIISLVPCSSASFSFSMSTSVYTYESIFPTLVLIAFASSPRNGGWHSNARIIIPKSLLICFTILIVLNLLAFFVFQQCLLPSRHQHEAFPLRSWASCSDGFPRSGSRDGVGRDR